tara:strand:- start:681 stop:1697 length:1017 start_codon:yes stop_codon:yes gene_type:complete
MMYSLSQFPRVKLAHKPTPLEPLTKLSKQLGRPHLYIKRDDCTGLATGGNKVRQLEFHLGKALQEECTTILVSGRTQSNMVRCTAAAAAKLGIGCHIFLDKQNPIAGDAYQNSGNILLSNIFGAFIHNYQQGISDQEIDFVMKEKALELQEQGQNPYLIYSSCNHPPYGVLGYLEAAQEIKFQLKRMDILKSTIVVASGSGITQAGLILGVKTSDDMAIDIHGICVRRERNLQKQRLTHILQNALTMLDNPETVKAEDISLCDHYLDPSHGGLGKQTKEAILLGAREEGILLDPVYTGKAFARFLDLAKQSHLEREPLIFLHTGGFPILFAYPDKLYP